MGGEGPNRFHKKKISDNDSQDSNDDSSSSSGFIGSSSEGKNSDSNMFIRSAHRPSGIQDFNYTKLMPKILKTFQPTPEKFIIP
jgi:hypothetical protein